MFNLNIHEYMLTHLFNGFKASKKQQGVTSNSAAINQTYKWGRGTANNKNTKNVYIV